MNTRRIHRADTDATIARSPSIPVVHRTMMSPGAVSTLARCALLGIAWTGSACGAGLQADLSVRIAMTPATYVPGQRNRVDVTVHNAGPDAAGTTTSSPSVVVYGGDFVVTTLPPPYEVVMPINGCGVERFVSEPLLDGNIKLVFVYYFLSIPAGQSRVCSVDIKFYPSTRTKVETRWEVRSPDTDPDLSNNVVSTTFAPALPAPVPTLAPWAAILLGLGLMSTPAIVRPRVASQRCRGKR